MASSKFDDLIPRPLPKPTQIEVTSVKPAVPDVSLVFDSSASNMQNYQPQRNNLLPNQKQSNVNAEIHHFANSDYDKSKLSVPFESSNYVSLAPTYTSPSSKKQSELYCAPKKVSFSPQSCKYDSKVMSPSQYYCPVDNSKSQSTPEPFSCCGHDLSTDFLNGHKYPVQQCTSHIGKTQHPNSDNDIRNEVIFQKQYSCLSWPQGCHGTNYCNRGLKEEKVSISSEEFQQVVLKFENMFLKLNCKYSKISENFVSKEEFSAITQKYENQIGVLLQRINELTSKLSREKCEHACLVGGRISDQSEKLNTVKYTRMNETQSCNEEVLRKDLCEKNGVSGTDYMSPGRIGLHARDCGNDQCSKFRGVCDEAKNSREHRIPREQYENTSPALELRPNHSNCTERPNNGRQYLASEVEDYFVTNSRSSTNQMNTVESNMRNRNETDKCEIEPVERPDLVTNSPEEKKQLKRMYNNIVGNVKNMIERNPPGNDNVSTIDFIKQATLEQFRKMGISVDDIEEEKYQSNDNLNVNLKLMNTEAVTPSDLSLHMHKLAMKYIANSQPDEVEQFEKRGSLNDASVRNNCNNRSIATLEYMERYHLLSAPDQYSNKTTSFNKVENIPSHRYKSYEPPDSNDRSFLR